MSSKRYTEEFRLETLLNRGSARILSAEAFAGECVILQGTLCRCLKSTKLCKTTIASSIRGRDAAYGHHRSERGLDG
jgi:hypothetical protein